MPTNAGYRTFIAGEALPAHRHVKIDTNVASSPPTIVFADAGDQGVGFTETAAASGATVAVRLTTAPGTVEVEAAETWTLGAVLYSANDGKVADTSAGTAIGQAMEACTNAGDIIEMVPYVVASTAAGNVSVLDSANHTLTNTVEAALAELYVHGKTAQAIIPIPLSSLTLEDGTALTKFVSEGNPTCGFSQEANKEIVLRFNNHGTPADVAAFGIPLPADLNPAADVVVHWRAKMSGATDTPVLEHECYLGAGDTDCAGADDEIDGAATLTEYTATIAHADVGGSPEELTLIFGPKASEMATDDLLVYSVWLEYTRQPLAA
jgi:hypothetical protein